MLSLNFLSLCKLYTYNFLEKSVCLHGYRLRLIFPCSSISSLPSLTPLSSLILDFCPSLILLFILFVFFSFFSYFSSSSSTSRIPSFLLPVSFTSHFSFFICHSCFLAFSFFLVFFLLFSFFLFYILLFFLLLGTFSSVILTLRSPLLPSPIPHPLILPFLIFSPL